MGAAACAPLVPSHLPPQLTQTPGVPVSAANDLFMSTLFSARVPDGWRIITSAADAPLTVIFVAPDNRALLVLAQQPVDAPPQPRSELPLRETSRDIALAAGTVYAYGVAPAAEWAAFEAEFTRVVESLTPP